MRHLERLLNSGLCVCGVEKGEGGEEVEGLTFEILRLHFLTAGLVFKLVVFTKKVVAERALEHPSTYRESRVSVSV